MESQINFSYFEKFHTITKINCCEEIRENIETIYTSDFMKENVIPRKCSISTTTL